MDAETTNKEAGWLGRTFAATPVGVRWTLLVLVIVVVWGGREISATRDDTQTDTTDVAVIAERIDGLEASVDKGFDGVSEDLGSLESRINERFDRADKRWSDRLGRMEERLGDRFDGVLRVLSSEPTSHASAGDQEGDG